MKRIVKSAMILIMTLVFLVGCTMKENIVFKISSDKKMTVKLIVAMDDEMIDAMINMGEDSSAFSEEPTKKEQKKHTDEERWKYLNEGDNKMSEPPEGFKSEKYEKDGFKGYVYSKEVGTIDDVSKESASERYNLLDSSKDEKEDDNDESSDVDMESLLKETLFIKKGNKYSSNMTLKSEQSASTADYEKYGASFDMKFVLELPNKPISNNATSVSEDGKTLSWDLLKNGDIDVEFELGGSNILLYVGIGAVALIVICGIVFALKKKGKGNAEQVQSAEVQLGGTPVSETPVNTAPSVNEVPTNNITPNVEETTTSETQGPTNM